jgi:hypothetical protein
MTGPVKTLNRTSTNYSTGLVVFVIYNEILCNWSHGTWPQLIKASRSAHPCPLTARCDRCWRLHLLRGIVVAWFDDHLQNTTARPVPVEVCNRLYKVLTARCAETFGAMDKSADISISCSFSVDAKICQDTKTIPSWQTFVSYLVNSDWLNLP